MQRGGAPCAVPALCERWAIFDPFCPMAEVTAVTPVFPYTRILRFLLSPKTQTIQTKIKLKLKLKQTMFHTENAGLLSKSAVFALWMHA